MKTSWLLVLLLYSIQSFGHMRSMEDIIAYPATESDWTYDAEENGWAKLTGEGVNETVVQIFLHDWVPYIVTFGKCPNESQREVTLWEIGKAAGSRLECDGVKSVVPILPLEETLIVPFPNAVLRLLNKRTKQFSL